MKKNLFLLGLAACFAGASWSAGIPAFDNSESDDPSWDLKLKPSVTKVLPTGEYYEEVPAWTPVVKTPVMHRAPAKGYTLDSLVAVKPDGSKYSKQCFKYNEAGKILEQTDYLFNAKTQKYEVSNQYVYTWYDNGYLKSDEQISASGSSVRNEYKYNDQLLGIEKLTTKRSSAEAEYENYRKGEYDYDERGNMTLERVLTWKNNAWEKSSETTCTYDANNYRASLEAWKLQKGEWIGYEKKEYENNAYGKNTFLLNYSWERTTSGVFEPFSRLTQAFSETDKDFLVTQKFEYYNTDEQAWTGNFKDRNGAERYNLLADKEFDDQGRVILSYSETLYGTEWRRGAYSDYVYTPEADGSTRCVKTSYIRAREEEDFRNNEIVTSVTSPAGMETYYHDDVITNPKLGSEKFCTYDERGNCTSSEEYKFNASGVRYHYLKAENTYDEWNNIIDTYNWKGKNNADGLADSWVYSSRFTYAYGGENGTERMDKRRYKYVESTESWANDWGEGADYNFDVPVSEIAIPTGYSSNYMQNAKYSYKGNGDGWDTTTYTFHYTKAKEDGVESVAARKSNVTFRENTLYVDGATAIDNTVYTTDGKLVYTGHSSEEYLGGLGNGLYIIRSVADGKTTIIKAVVK